MARDRSNSHLRRVRVETAAGYNYVGTVVRLSRDSGQLVLVIEDTQGRRRIARPAYPGVSVVDLDGGGSQ